MPLHHPNEDTLMRHASRRLSSALSLAVELHLDTCPRCRSFVIQCEALGGALLENSVEETMRPESLAEVLQWAESEEKPAPKFQPAQTWPASAEGLALPRALRFCRFGSWHWVAPGMRFARVVTPGAGEGSLILLKAGAKRELPLHGHEGIELTQVLSGRFSDHLGHYGVGDLIERDDDILHRPIVDPDGECICLIATENKLVFQGFIARLVQSWTGV